MTVQTHEEAVLSSLARKASGGRRVKDLRAFFSALREEESPQEFLRKLFYRIDFYETDERTHSNGRNHFS